MGDWADCAVDNIKSTEPNALATGPFGSAIGSRFFTNSGIPLIRGGNLSQEVGTRLIDDGFVFIAEDKAKEFSRSIAQKGDLIFTCWGTIDQVGLIDERSRFPFYIISNKQMKLTPDPNKADSLFLYYLFSSDHMRETIRSQGIGSSVPRFNLGQLRSIRLKLPPLRQQHTIAYVLGTLDDKIELNRRMNETLEAMARTMFKAWFVDFEPIKAKAAGATSFRSMPQDLFAQLPDRIADSDLGPIPNGWHHTSVGDLVEVVGGGTPSTKNSEFWEGGEHAFCTPKDMSGLTSPVLLVVCL